MSMVYPTLRQRSTFARAFSWTIDSSSLSSTSCPSIASSASSVSVRASPPIGTTGSMPESPSTSLTTEYTVGKQRLPRLAKSATKSRRASPGTFPFAEYGAGVPTPPSGILVPMACIVPRSSHLLRACPLPSTFRSSALCDVIRSSNPTWSSSVSILVTFRIMTTDWRFLIPLPTVSTSTITSTKWLSMGSMIQQESGSW